MQQREVRYLTGLLVASLVCCGAVIAESIAHGEFLYVYLLWNLLLAWLPLGFGYWLKRTLQDKLWSSWEALTLSLAWLVFLPNSFYIVSDYIHLGELPSSQLLPAGVITSAFALTGLWLGATSLNLIQREIARRYGEQLAVACSVVILLASSFAIYIGRDLRWNSWDVLANPFGLIFDLSERLIHPSEYPQVLAVVLPFFVFLIVLYFLPLWLAASPEKMKRSRVIDKS